jgi:hypothetical protein
LVNIPGGSVASAETERQEGHAPGAHHRAFLG